MIVNIENIPSTIRYFGRSEFFMLFLICKYCKEKQVNDIDSRWMRDYFKDNGLYLATSTIVEKCNYFSYNGFLIKNAPYKFSVNPSIITLQFHNYE